MLARSNNIDDESEDLKEYNWEKDKGKERKNSQHDILSSVDFHGTAIW
jgi:hypothetical protein